jgi:cytochrome c oxidase subunit 3
MNEANASPANAPHVPYFQDLERQAHAARLGMWVFLASELLLFAGLFALYASYRAHYPQAFGWGVEHNVRLLGTLNTAVLICSSYAVASSVHVLRQGRAKLAAALIAFTLASGVAFLVIKGYEYASHFREGVFPGGQGRFFLENPAPGLKLFYTLYFLMTGLHGIHVIVGMGVLTWLLVRILRGKVAPPFTHPLDIGAIYWHLIDVVWIFLWPIFYLTPGSS